MLLNKNFKQGTQINTWESGGNTKISGSMAKSRNILWLPGPGLISNAFSLGSPLLLSYSTLHLPANSHRHRHAIRVRLKGSRV